MTLHAAIVAVMLTAAITAAVVAPAAAQSAPPSDDAAARVSLNDSSRHGEYVDIAVAGRAKPVNAFVVYPEIAAKAAVVVVTHEDYKLTDWVRGVADQLAADGFIAIAPDLSGGEDQAAALLAVQAYGSKLPASNGKTTTTVLKGAPRLLEDWAVTVANLRKQIQ